MKMKSIITGIVCAAVLVGVVVFLMPNDRRKIKKQFSRMSKHMAKEREESVLVMATKGASVMDLLTDPCEIQSADMKWLGVTQEICSKNEAVKIMTMFRDQFSVMSLSFQNINIDLVDKNSANVELCAKLEGKTRADEAVREIRVIKCVLLKKGRKWLFNKCIVSEIAQEK
ncbi:hypothetical protein ACFLS1_04405 [Verrucomicrobiota bacterium]